MITKPFVVLPKDCTDNSGFCRWSTPWQTDENHTCGYTLPPKDEVAEVFVCSDQEIALATSKCEYIVIGYTRRCFCYPDHIVWAVERRLTPSPR